MDEKLFKAILSECLKLEYESLTAKDVVIVALGAVNSFAMQNGIDIKEIVKDK